MMDKTIPHIGVLMTRPVEGGYPRFPLPAGYALRTYEPGMEKDWAELQASVEHADTVEAALALFEREFREDAASLKTRGLFLYGPDGRLAASALLWYGNHFGSRSARVHWVAVAPQEQGKGLCKALMTLLMDRCMELGETGLIYLTSQTWSYKAIGIYEKFGFLPYAGPCPESWRPASGDYSRETAEAWALIDEKLRAYQKRR